MYAIDIPNRRNLINAAFRILIAKDPITTMRKFEKKYGLEIREAHAFAHEAYGNCMAAKEEDVDNKLSEKFGWKTMRQLRKESIDALKQELL
ncbi:hypothetical protein Milano_075 [Agrobacterium phage Milano]|nr:hypothetical protein Milano_075 [Agrobacterium phage Milano]